MVDIYSSNDALLRDYARLNQEYKNKAGRYIKNLLKIQRAESGLDRTIRKLTGENSSENRQNIRCDFCGKQVEAVTRMIAGPSVYICNECIKLCSEILAEDGSLETEGEKCEEADHAEMSEAEE